MHSEFCAEDYDPDEFEEWKAGGCKGKLKKKVKQGLKAKRPRTSAAAASAK